MERLTKILKEYGEERLARPIAQALKREDYLLAPESGIFEITVELGAKVKRGQPVEIASADGRLKGEGRIELVGAVARSGGRRQAVYNPATGAVARQVALASAGIYDADSLLAMSHARARAMMSWAIRRCAEVAPVEVPIVPGNHDSLAAFHIGEVLAALDRNGLRPARYLVTDDDLVRANTALERNVQQVRAFLAAQGLEVGGVDLRLAVFVHAGARGQAAGELHQVGVVAAQVNGRNRADSAKGGDAAREAVCRYTDAHAALHDRQQGAVTQGEGPQATVVERVGARRVDAGPEFGACFHGGDPANNRHLRKFAA